MNSRERTFLTLERKRADRIPVDFWASGGMRRKLSEALGISFEEFLDRYDVDFRYIAGPRYVGPGLEEGVDIWGVKRVQVDVALEAGAESYSEVAESPLALARGVEDVEAYGHWPSADWFDYSVVEEQCEAVRQEERVVVFMGDRLNRVAQLKPAMYLRGLENVFIDLATREEIGHAILGKVKAFYLEYLSRILDAANGKIDIVLTGDDFGSQNAPLISPSMWRRFIRPGFADYVGLIKSRGAKAMHHTCGAVSDIIPDMVECGLDVLQSLQPEATGMSLSCLMSEFGDRLCFHGGISIQRTLPFGAPDEVREEVRQVVEASRETGGYIFGTAHNIQADTSVENVLALMEAYREFGAL